MIKKIFKIKGMHCTACTLEIDDKLEETEGILESYTHYAKGETQVKFDEAKLNDKKIIDLIKQVGYTASLE